MRLLKACLLCLGIAGCGGGNQNMCNTKTCTNGQQYSVCCDSASCTYDFQGSKCNCATATCDDCAARERFFCLP